ncbi:MAG: 50S ribosomal protein L18 [Chlamydiales bacterium]|jgi:large subunit ribosomal protein L18|nr:50S ribosomal protein L18 [Chlamydiales bacterium]
MLNELQSRNTKRKRRSLRVRKQVRGSSDKPRLSVFKSLKHICAQLIDDEKGITLVSTSTYTPLLRQKNLGKKSKQAAREVGILLANAAKQKNIQCVVFDRGHYKYHGLLAELADAARQSGLQF